jgi:hypothetical protein
VPVFVLGGFCLAGLGAGIVLGVDAQAASDQMRSGVHSYAVSQSLHDRTQAEALGANISYGAAIAAGTAAVVVFLVQSRSAP